MSIKSFFSFVVIVGMIALGPVVSEGREPSRKGLVDERPESGRFVETARGYMVAYEERIPGTDITFQMVPIPGGQFLLGSPGSEAGRKDSEGPQVSITVEPFWMGRHEVTWKEFRIYMGLEEASKKLFRHRRTILPHDDHVDAVTAPSEVYDISFAHKGGDGPDTPAVTMTQFTAKQYTKWLSMLLQDFYRLPSEAEWEYACRAGTTTAYSFGDDTSKLENYAWFAANSNDQRHEVGSKLPNPWGLYDMHGSVAEWVLDAFSPDGYTTIADGILAWEDAIRWPDKLYPRVARGGSWELGAGHCRSAARLASNEAWNQEDPDLPHSPYWHTSFEATGVGFRLMRPLSVPKTAPERERYWGADIEEIRTTVDQRIENGRGLRGVVDPNMATVILPPGGDSR